MTSLHFDQPDILRALRALDVAGLDTLGFGVIGFDAQRIVQVYNRAESEATQMTPDRVIGKPVFTDIAQCMNNYLVAQPFESAELASEALDRTIDYVLTWRMRPTKVRLRMVSAPDCALRYVLLQRVA